MPTLKGGEDSLPADLSPEAQSLLDRLGFEDGHECRASPHGWHEAHYDEDGERVCCWIHGGA